MHRPNFIAALAAAAVLLAAVGSATARTTLVTTLPKISAKIATPKISVPKICKNEISRTFVGPNGISYTAKKCG